MTTYDATRPCRNIACTVVEYAYDSSGEIPTCPACRDMNMRRRLTAAVARAEAADLARAVAAVTPCTCSAQRERAEAAEAKVARVVALLDQCADMCSDCRLEYNLRDALEADQ